MKDLKVIFPKPMIRREVYRLSEYLSTKYKNIHVVIVGGSGLFFGSDVIKNMDDSVTGVSYLHCRKAVNSSEEEEIVITGSITEDISKKDVIIIDSVCSTGITLLYLSDYLRNECRSIITACLINKKARRVLDFNPDLSCFELDKDIFLVGYGMNLENRYKSLDSIYYI